MKTTRGSLVEGRDLPDRGYSVGRTAKDFVTGAELAQGYTNVGEGGLDLPDEGFERERYDPDTGEFVDKFHGGYLTRFDPDDPREE